MCTQLLRTGQQAIQLNRSIGGGFDFESQLRIAGAHTTCAPSPYLNPRPPVHVQIADSEVWTSL